MRATKASRRSASRHAARSRKSASRTRSVAAAKVKAAKAAKPVKVVKPGSKLAPAPQVFFRLCKSGWAVIVDTIPNAQGTRFVCPFCPLSHRVPGPVRGFKKFRRAQWVKLRRVEE